MIRLMRKIHLTTATQLALESRHRKCSDKRESDRIKAVLLCSKGWSAAMIAEALSKEWRAPKAILIKSKPNLLLY